MDISTAAGLKPVVAVKPTNVSVNGVSISREDIAREAQNHPAATPRDAWLSAARALAIRELLLQRARTLGLTAVPMSDENGRRETDDEALVRAVIEIDVVVPTADDAACARFYARNLKRFRTPDLFAASHILIAAAPGDIGGRDAARQSADAILAAALEAPELFEHLAKAHSACPSKDLGGALGQIGPGQTVPEFERALATIPAGTIGREPVETRYGFHIIRVEHCELGRQLPLKAVHKRIAEYLDERVRRSAAAQYVAVLAGAADIAGIDLNGSTT
ncbi:MAG: peptidylprolyl isomerase, partial [Verrucomicrobiae bacterium]|nr:peptidylprolyl isomerase [Verrucomicrobiae bacterium]